MAFDPTSLPPATLAHLLSAGSWVLVEDDARGSLSRTTSGILVDATPAKVREVLSDFGSYREWMPQLTRSEVVERKGAATEVAYTLSFRFSVFSRSLDYSVRYRTKGEDRIEWERVSGDFQRNDGTWTWIPVERGKKTAVFYSFYVDIGGMGTMVKMALKASPQMEVAIASSTAVLVARSLRGRVE